jgi:hypothetical protein
VFFVSLVVLSSFCTTFIPFALLIFINTAVGTIPNVADFHCLCRSSGPSRTDHWHTSDQDLVPPPHT